MESKKFVFDRKYDNYFLFMDNEIVMNNVFYKKIKHFSSEIHGKELIIDLVNLRGNENYVNKHTCKILNSSLDTFEVLSHVNIGNSKTFEDLLFEFLIYDDTNEWAIYCHIGSDFGLAGCSDLVYNAFLESINPYEKLSFEEKLNEIEQTFIDKKMKDEFIHNLRSNYNLK